jgi:hypothetical protein
MANPEERRQTPARASLQGGLPASWYALCLATLVVYSISVPAVVMMG